MRGEHERRCGGTVVASNFNCPREQCPLVVDLLYSRRWQDNALTITVSLASESYHAEIHRGRDYHVSSTVHLKVWLADQYPPSKPKWSELGVIILRWDAIKHSLILAGRECIWPSGAQGCSARSRPMYAPSSA